jgi:hypothetical protein
MVCKKGLRFTRNIFSIGRDIAINQVLLSFNMPITLTVYNIISANPIQVAVALLATKFGIHSKIVVAVIIAFLL